MAQDISPWYEFKGYSFKFTHISQRPMSQQHKAMVNAAMSSPWNVDMAAYSSMEQKSSMQTVYIHNANPSEWAITDSMA